MLLIIIINYRTATIAFLEHENAKIRNPYTMSKNGITAYQFHYLRPGGDRLSRNESVAAYVAPSCRS